MKLSLIQNPLLMTSFFLFLSLALFLLIKRFKTNVLYARKKEINILNAISLGGKDRLLLVEVENKKILLGLTSSSIERLHVFESETKR